MDSHAILASRPDRLLQRASVIRFSRWTLGALTVWGFSLAVFTWIRRVQDALERPLDATGLLVTAGLLALTSTALRWLWPLTAPIGNARWVTPLIVALPTATWILFATALSLPGTSPAGLTGFWAIMAVEQGLSLWLVAHRLKTQRDGLPPDAGRGTLREEESVLDSTETGGRRGAAESAAWLPAEPEPTEHPLAPDVLQQLTRSHDGDGRESIYGLLRARFAPGLRSVSLNVAFCPPFRGTPKIVAHVLDGADARVKVAKVVPYGARIDLRLSTFSQTTEEVVVEMHAHEPSS